MYMTDVFYKEKMGKLVVFLGAICYNKIHISTIILEEIYV